jgi:hypothetical protein
MPATPVQSHKRSQSSGLDTFALSVSKVSDALCSALAPTSLEPDIPCRRQHALKQAQLLEKPWLTKSQLLSLIHILQKDNQAVETYVVLDNDVWVDWVCEKLDIPVPIHWSDSE